MLDVVVELVDKVLVVLGEGPRLLAQASVEDQLLLVAHDAGDPGVLEVELTLRLGLCD